MASFSFGERLDRAGDEIVVCGQLFHTNARVVTWLDPGGYSGYTPAERVCRDPAKRRSPELVMTFGPRKVKAIVDGQPTLVPVEDWDLPRLQAQVHQLVLHYDECGTSHKCFQVLHDERALSIHFMVDLDGTIYQTLDLKECAWHATIANHCSVGVEIANVGCCPAEERSPRFDLWYGPLPGSDQAATAASVLSHTRAVTDSDAAGPGDGSVQIILPPGGLDPRVRLKERGAVDQSEEGFVGHPLRPCPVRGKIHGIDLQQYDFTKEQYDALACLAAALSVVLPRIKPVYPTQDMEEEVPEPATQPDIPVTKLEPELKVAEATEPACGWDGEDQTAQARQNQGSCPAECDGGGKKKLVVALTKLKDEISARFEGILGHYHIQRNKVDPGPAFQWDLLTSLIGKRLGGGYETFHS